MAHNAYTRGYEAGSIRPKLDPRLAFLLSLSQDELGGLKGEEDRQLQRLEAEIRRALVQAEDEDGPESEYRARLRELADRLFAPITTGVYLPEVPQELLPVGLRERYVSAFILSDASAADLAQLGVRVRNQAGDTFTALIPM